MYNKYGNKKVVSADGHKFDSQREAHRYAELKIAERANLISSLQLQVKFELVPKQINAYGKMLRPMCYVADFVYKDADGNVVVEDCKGFRTREYKDKAKLMLHLYGITIKET